jgi:hypothetical protein
MSVDNGKDYLYLIWKDNQTRKQYVIGQLSKNGEYEFVYGFEVNEAIERGFKPLLSFENLDDVYKNPSLFPVFTSRLPDRKRTGIDKILKKYNLDEYDEYLLLKRSGAKLPIDNLEFIDPILNDDEPIINRSFCIAGPRHYIGCDGVDCAKSLDVIVGDSVYLLFEPNNKHDLNAIKINNRDNKQIGYLPRYYCESVKQLIESGYNYECIISEVQRDLKCNECIKAQLTLTKPQL